MVPTSTCLNHPLLLPIRKPLPNLKNSPQLQDIGLKISQISYVDIFFLFCSRALLIWIENGWFQEPLRFLRWGQAIYSYRAQAYTILHAHFHCFFVFDQINFAWWRGHIFYRLSILRMRKLQQQIDPNVWRCREYCVLCIMAEVGISSTTTHSRTITKAFGDQSASATSLQCRFLMFTVSQLHTNVPGLKHHDEATICVKQHFCSHRAYACDIRHWKSFNISNLLLNLVSQTSAANSWINSKHRVGRDIKGTDMMT